RRRRVAAVAVILLLLLLLLIGLGVVDTAARRGIARFVRRAIGGIDVAIVSPSLRLRHHALLRRRDHDGIAGGVVLLLLILRQWRAASDGGIGAPRIARQRDLRRAGQRHRGIEHTFLLHQIPELRGILARQSHAAM